MKKKTLVLIVLLVAVAAYFSAGPVADLLDQARGNYNEIKGLCEGRQCELAEAELEIIYERHPSSRFVSRAENLVAECYWEQALLQDTYAKEIEKAEIVFTRFPDAECASEARDFAIRRYENWGNSLAEEGDYEGAVDKLQVILEKYPDYEYIGLIKSDILRILLKEAAEHRAVGEYFEAMIVYDRIATKHLEGVYKHEADEVEEEAVRCLLEWGENLQREKKYGEAVDAYIKAVEEYPNAYLPDLHGYSRDLAEEEMARCLQEWAKSLKEVRDYGEALERYLMITEELPETSYRDAALDAVPETCFEWALYLEGDEHYPEAWDKYTLLIEEYSSYPYSYDYKSEAVEALPRVVLGWGISLDNEGNYQEALEKYSLIIEEYSDYPYPEEYRSKAENRIPGCYYRWAHELIEEGSFEEALQRYSVVLEEYPWSSWASEDNATLLEDIPSDFLFDSAAQYKEAEKYNTAIMLYKVIAIYHPEDVYAYDAANAAITTEIEKIYNEQHGLLPPPYEAAEKNLSGECEVEVVNDTPYVLTILISGPTNMSITIEASPGSTVRIMPPFSWQEPPQAAKRETMTIPPGDYRVAAKVRETGVIPFYGEWSLTGDRSYRNWFFLIQRFG